MRDIKFRQFYNGRMEYVGFITEHGCEILRGFPNCNRDKYPVMQYTGLKDKNGVEIYEGDIFNTTVLAGHPTDRWGGDYWVEVTAKVDFVSGRFVGVVFAHTKSSYEPEYKNGYFDGRIVEIRDEQLIGNIHQNPELLGD